MQDGGRDGRLRVGIVGCGAIAREAHIPALLERQDVVITALCDSIAENAVIAKLEGGLSADILEDAAELAGKVDCALVAIPPRLHAPVSQVLLAAGIDVMCEKPTAESAQAARDMAAAAAAGGRMLSVGLTQRYHSNNELLRQILAEGLLGRLQRIRLEMGAPLDWEMQSDAYYNRDKTAGGVFYDAGIHLLDRALWLFGDLGAMHYADDSYGGVESNARLTGRMEVAAQSLDFEAEFSWTHLLGNNIRIEGESATAEVRMHEPDCVFLHRELGGKPVVMRIQRDADAASDPLVLQWESFLHSVRSRVPDAGAADTTIRALEVIEAAYAARTRLSQPWVETGRAAI